MRHVLSALVQNQPGVLAHISGMLASRGFNIDSLAVGATEVTDLSRMTFVVHGDDLELEQVRKQLDKIVTVVKVQDISSEDFVERDLMIIKVKSASHQRMEISLLVEMFRGRVVDISAENIMVEISGQERKIEAFIELMRPYGIIELARTGRIALVRGLPSGGRSEEHTSELQSPCNLVCRLLHEKNKLDGVGGVHRLADHGAQIDGLPVQRTALIEAGEQQQVVDEDAHAGRLVLDPLHRLGQVLG